MNEELVKRMNEYLEYLKKTYETNPELARKKAKEALQRTGILDEKGKIAPPYNGNKVNADDFTRGPGVRERQEEQKER